jgi:hypothetical protein
MNESLSRLISTDRLKAGIDKTAWITMKHCGVCGTATTVKGGLFAQLTRGVKKYHCKFCYKAVCSNCSLQRAKHPESKTSERICNSCFLENFETAIRTSMQAQIDEKNVELISARRTLEADQASAASFKARAQETLLKIGEIERLGQSKEGVIKSEVIDQTAYCSALEEEIDQLRRVVNKLTCEGMSLFDAVAATREQIRLTKESLQDDSSSTLQEDIGYLEATVDELQVELDSFGTSDDAQDHAETVERMIEESEREKLRLLNDQDMLHSKLHEVTVQTKLKEGNIATLKAQISVFAVPTQAEMAELPRDIFALRDILESTETEFQALGGDELISRIKKLKEELREQALINTQMNEKIGQDREYRFSQEDPKQDENCRLQ